jgi:hypothetical protein
LAVGASLALALGLVAFEEVAPRGNSGPPPEQGIGPGCFALGPEVSTHGTASSWYNVTIAAACGLWTFGDTRFAILNPEGGPTSLPPTTVTLVGGANRTLGTYSMPGATGGDCTTGCDVAIIQLDVLSVASPLDLTGDWFEVTIAGPGGGSLEGSFR